MSTEFSFSHWLRLRRDGLGVTQESLSAHLGFSPATMRKLESGERRPSGQIAYILAEYFHIPDDEREAFVAFARSGQEVASLNAPTDLPREPNDGSPPGSKTAPWLLAYKQHTNLHSVLTPIIGRASEEAAVRDGLLDPRARLVTLVGTGGIGKTRLALEVASSLVSHFQEGVFFVDLTPVMDPEAVLPAVARTLGLKEESNRPMEGVLLDYARGRRMLLVLDNFEQVLDAGVAVARLMEASPWLKVLVTSREALHIRGERCFPVPPLAFPDPHETPAAQALSSYPSVQLFLERARDVAADFSFTPENAAKIAAICATLEGLPLAIELAAARSNHYSPSEIIDALSSPLKLLTGGAPDAPARHRTLRNTIEWSYNLLNQGEQSLFRSLSVFSGGFTPQAVEALSTGTITQDASVSDVLASLSDKHLVRKEIGERHTTRFGIVEPVRQYLIEQAIKHAEAVNLRRKHAQYYSSLARAADQHFNGPQSLEWGTKQIQWINRIEDDLENMRVALDWYVERATIEQAAAEGATGAASLENAHEGLKLAIALRRVWLGRGHFIEGLQWLKRFLALLPEKLPHGKHELHTSYATALLVEARLSIVQGDSGAVRTLLEESLRIAVDLDDKQQLAMTWFNLGSVALAQMDYTTARSYQAECLKLFRKLGNRWGAAAALEDIGSIEISEGNPAPAGPLFEESLALYREVGEYFGAASALEGLGRVHYYSGDYAAASELWEESLQLSEEIGYRSRTASSLVLLGWAALRLGNADHAASLFRSGLLLAHRLGAVFTIHWGLAGLGALAGAQGQSQQAALLFAAADTLQRARAIQLTPTDAGELQMEMLAAQMHGDKQSWDSAWEQGNGMALDKSVQFATAPRPQSKPLRKSG